ncbi:hypothetical protein EV421DRAFT_1741879 [Armillaria borealis]|uniref:Uncharacterized protein n=1 Tax=Armillaria borealis TaxID=47425 RepID=A0AA39MGV2_9AGAR|nr:hypothetical protein EV421DRAFT_1741879 [Armillaria borealis]
MSKQSGRIKIDEDMPLPKAFLASLSNQGDEDTLGDDDDEDRVDATSGDEGSDDESEDGSDGSKEEVVSKVKGAAKNQNQKVPSPKKKFTTPKEPEVGLSITIPVGPPKKAPKTQPGSVKDEPIPTASSSQGSRALQHPKGKGEEKPVASSSKAAAPVTVTIKNKKHLAFSTHRYGREVPVPVKDEEIETIVQASIMCSSSVQNQPCVFLGWGKHCNNCKAATKSLFSYRAEPVQHYHTCKELAKFVEVMPDNVHTSITCTSTALQVFDTCTNAAAQAAQQYRASLEETLMICQDATANKGRNALRGIIFESLDFEEQLCIALVKLDRHSSAPLNTTGTSSFDQIVAQALRRPPLMNESPSLPVVEGSGGVTTPARSQEVSVAPKNDLGDELHALVDPTMSSPVHLPIESLKDA